MAARRDVKALTAGIAELNAGDRVRIGITHPRYGDCSIEATVTAGESTLAGGGWNISKGGKPSKHLTELVILASAGKHEFGIGEEPAPQAPAALAA